MEFPPNTFFGVVNDADPKSDQAKVYPGYIVSDEDNTSILMVPNSVFYKCKLTASYFIVQR